MLVLYPFRRFPWRPVCQSTTTDRPLRLCERTLLPPITRYSLPITASRLCKKHSFLHKYLQLPTRNSEEPMIHSLNLPII